MLAKRDPDTTNQVQESTDGERDKRAKKEGSMIIESELHASGNWGDETLCSLNCISLFNMIRMGSMGVTEFARVDLVGCMGYMVSLTHKSHQVRK